MRNSKVRRFEVWSVISVVLLAMFVLFFVCRTYQRFTKAGVCTCHSIKEQTVTNAVIEKLHEVCDAFLNAEELRPIAEEAVEQAKKADGHESELQALQGKIEALTANLDKMYMDKLSGLLSDQDFGRIYTRIKAERSSLEEKRKEVELQIESPVSTKETVQKLVQQFSSSVFTCREVLCSLIERIELTENKEIIIKFRFRELEAVL